MNNREKSEILENRIIDFTINLNKLLVLLPNTPLGQNLVNQMSRSSLSPALHYGEAQSAESTKDFIHKMGICLKELRETQLGIKIIQKAKLLPNKQDDLKKQFDVSNELISIFVAAIKTAKRKSQTHNR